MRRQEIRAPGTDAYALISTSAGRAFAFCVLTAITILSLVASLDARADQWSIVLNGKAIHLDEMAQTTLNEENWGGGVQYDFDVTENNWVPFVSASGFKDSNGNPSWYAGGGTVRRFSFGEGKDAPHLDLGAIGFLMVRKDFRGGDPFPGILPVASIGYQRFALNVTYIPKVDPKMVPLIFLQLKIGVR